MDALISARAGIAVLIEDQGLALLQAGSLGEAIPCQAEELHLLFGEALDLQILEGMNRNEIVQRLDREAAGQDALQVALILLDPELPGEIRYEAAKDLNLLLVKAEIREALESILFAYPLPAEADLLGALAHAHRQGWARGLLVRLQHLQPFIEKAHHAWLSIPDRLFASSSERDSLRAMLIRGGNFRTLAVTLRENAPTAPLLAEALRLHPIYGEVIRAWFELAISRPACDSSYFGKAYPKSQELPQPPVLPWHEISATQPQAEAQPAPHAYRSVKLQTIKALQELQSEGLLHFDSLEEIQRLSELATQAIRAQLHKAELDQAEHIDDILQESLMELCRIKRKAPIRKFHWYFLKVFRISARRYIREVAQRQRLGQQLAEVMRDNVCLPEEPLRDERSLVLAALSKLSQRHREIIEMMILDKSPEEIQTTLGYKSQGTLRVASHRALKKLRGALHGATENTEYEAAPSRHENKSGDAQTRGRSYKG
jgi:RNA polymerase sigma factor (sigma-70 family)